MISSHSEAERTALSQSRSCNQVLVKGLFTETKKMSLWREIWPTWKQISHFYKDVLSVKRGLDWLKIWSRSNQACNTDHYLILALHKSCSLPIKKWLKIDTFDCAGFIHSKMFKKHVVWKRHDSFTKQTNKQNKKKVTLFTTISRKSTDTGIIINVTLRGNPPTSSE